MGKADVNALGEGGELQVGILSEEGKPISGYHAANCVRIDGDSIDLPVAWEAKGKLVGLDHSHVRFRFKLKNAKLFSFWID